MRLPLLALLSVATTAFCQSSTPRDVDPDKLFQMPEKFSETMPDANRPAIVQKFRMDSVHPTLHMELVLPGPNPVGPKLNNPQIDPKIILHPPWPSKGDESKGREVSRRQYPNLRFLPIQRGPGIQ